MTLLMKVTWQVEGHWTAFVILCNKLVEIWNLKQSTWHDIQQQSFSILRKTSSIWQLFPHNLGDGNQLFQIKFISLVLQPLYLPGSFLFKFYFTLTKLARNSQILHRKQSKKCNKRKKTVFFILKFSFSEFFGYSYVLHIYVRIAKWWPDWKSNESVVDICKM